VLSTKFICKSCHYLEGLHESLHTLLTIQCGAARAVVEPFLRSAVPRYELCPHRTPALSSEELKQLAAYARERARSPEDLTTFEKLLILQRDAPDP
jgi:hypothetical protein